MTFLRIPLHTFLVTLWLVTGAQIAAAQSPFDIVAKVNERIVTYYELDQRILFMKVLGTAGSLEKQAKERLIEERLYYDAADLMGIEATDEAVKTGMEEFAARADLKTDEFLAALAEEGIDPQTFQDFVRAGIVWREVVGARFASRAQITDAEIDRALSLSSRRGGVNVLLSEIILPADTPENKERAEALGAEISKLRTQDSFSEAARAVSASQSAPNGGRLDWVSLATLPPPFRPMLLTLAPGEITDPIEIPNAILFFQMRGKQETQAPVAKDLAVEYAKLLLPGGRTPENLQEGRDLKYNADVCDDLYGLYPNSTVQQLDILTQVQSDVPNDIALELAKLDEGEISTNLTRNNGDYLLILMLCGRTAEIVEDESRQALRNNLTNQRIESYAAAYLAELRATAAITEQ